MALEEVRPGLRRWTAWHEEWREDVGALAVDTRDGLVLIDPIEPPRGLRRPDHVLLTTFFHTRAASTLRPGRVWASARTVRAVANRGLEVTDPIRRDADLPGGIRAFETARRGELVFWLPEHRAVVAGDVLLGAGAKPRASDELLRLCPQGWLGAATHDHLRASLAPLLDLPVQRVLVSHGRPVLRAGRRALERVLQAPSAA